MSKDLLAFHEAVFKIPDVVTLVQEPENFYFLGRIAKNRTCFLGWPNESDQNLNRCTLEVELIADRFKCQILTQMNMPGKFLPQGHISVIILLQR
jgi:hypothetical protein